MADDDTPQGPLSPQNIIQQLGLKGPEGVLAQAAMQQSAAQSQAQQAYAQSLQAREGALSQTGISPLDKASMFFQAAGALAAPTRSGSLMESIGSTGTALAGPLSRAAQADRDRQEKLAQLQMARQKLAADSAGTNMPIDKLAALLKSQRDQEAQDVETFKPQLIGPGKYALVGDAGTIKPIPPELLSSSAGAQPSGLTGEDLLKTADPRQAATVRAWIKGDMPVPVPGSKAAERVQAELDLLKDATADDPGAYNNITSGKRKQMATAMASDKPNTMGFNLRGAAAMLGHLSEWQDRASELENTHYPLINAPINVARAGTDNPVVRNWETANETYQKEAARAIKGGVPAASETAERMKLANVNDGPNTLQGHADTVKALLVEKITPMMDNYNSSMGTNYTDVRSFLKDFAPSSVKAYDKLDTTAVLGSDKHKALKAAESAAPATAPAAAVPPGTQVGEKRQFKQGMGVWNGTNWVPAGGQ